MAEVRIVTDSSCDLTAEEAANSRIEIVPLTIRFGNEEFVDGSGLSPEEFYRKMASTDTLPETAAPSPGAFEERFRKLAGEGADSVICINISRGLSATMESAQQAAKAIGDDFDVRVIDSESITSGLGTMCLHAASAAQKGMSPDEVVALVESMRDRTYVFGTLDTLDNLKKGGRIGNAQALIGSMLSIKPILDISGGVVEEAGKQRTRKKALGWMRNKLKESRPLDEIAIVHAEAPDSAAFADQIREDFPDQKIRIGYMGPVIGTHAGPGTIGVAWLKP